NPYTPPSNRSPDRQGGVGPADCLNRSLTVAARYRIFKPCGAALGGMSACPQIQFLLSRQRTNCSTSFLTKTHSRNGFDFTREIISSLNRNCEPRNVS